MNFKRYILICLLPLLSSCENRDSGNQEKFAIDWEIGTNAANLNLVDPKSIKSEFDRIGLRTVSEGEDYDFTISISIHDFKESEETHAFCSIGYDIYFEDSLYSVSPSIDIDGRLDSEKLKLAFEFLNGRLIYILENYPNQSRDQIASSEAAHD